MGQGDVRPGEALTEERSWESDGVTVLTASVTLPQLDGGGARARRFNRYYRRLCRAYLAGCERLLLPEAATSCRAAMEVSAPWTVARASLCGRDAFHAGDVLSVVCDVREELCGAPPFQLRRAEVWDLSLGLPMALEEFFPPRTRCKKTLLRFAREETLRRAEAGMPCRADWRAALRRSLNTRNFYLTDAGLCFFCPAAALREDGAGVATFTMPYDEQRGPYSCEMLFPPRHTA